MLQIQIRVKGAIAIVRINENQCLIWENSQSGLDESQSRRVFEKAVI